MPKIAILRPDLRGGGAEKLNLDLAREFASQGHEVEFVLMEASGDLLPNVEKEFSIYDLACRRIRQVPTALADYLRSRQPDCLLAAMWPLTVCAPIARSLSSHQCSVVISEHNPLSIQYKSWGRLHNIGLRASTALAYRMADARIAVSSGVASDLAALSGMSKKQFSVVYNPIPAHRKPSTKAIENAARFWNGDKGPRILTVGSLKKQKNHDLLLQSFARLSSPAARLVLLGQGPLEGELRNRASELGIADRVSFAGFRSDPTPFYRSADLFVLSSDYEGFGNVIVEALACGTPVVSTDCPSGPSEILLDGEFGTVVPVGDAEALSRAMAEALTADHDPEKLKQRARDFSPERAAKAYLDLLLLASGRAVPSPAAEL